MHEHDTRGGKAHLRIEQILILHKQWNGADGRVIEDIVIGERAVRGDVAEFGERDDIQIADRGRKSHRLQRSAEPGHGAFGGGKRVLLVEQIAEGLPLVKRIGIGKKAMDELILRGGALFQFRVDPRLHRPAAQSQDHILQRLSGCSRITRLLEPFGESVAGQFQVGGEPIDRLRRPIGFDFPGFNFERCGQNSVAASAESSDQIIVICLRGDFAIGAPDQSIILGFGKHDVEPDRGGMRELDLVQNARASFPRGHGQRPKAVGETDASSMSR